MRFRKDRDLPPDHAAIKVRVKIPTYLSCSKSLVILCFYEDVLLSSLAEWRSRKEERRGSAGIDACTRKD
jgi:hypothetical protein